MHEHNRPSHEQEPKRADADALAELLYFTLDREEKTHDMEVGEVAESIGGYLDGRTERDPEMGHLLVNALESYRDPQPEMETLAALEGMQLRANYIRRILGLPERALPTEIPPPPAEPWVAPQ
jgi:hypothetical protein